MTSCPRCKGTGREYAQMMGDIGRCKLYLGAGRMDNIVACPKCKGETYVWPNPGHCDVCNGTGYASAAT